jgi:hypothetical protein
MGDWRVIAKPTIPLVLCYFHRVRGQQYTVLKSGLALYGTFYSAACRIEFGHAMS